MILENIEIKDRTGNEWILEYNGELIFVEFTALETELAPAKHWFNDGLQREEAESTWDIMIRAAFYCNSDWTWLGTVTPHESGVIEELIKTQYE